jgi:outer membrane protein assembly factor BamE (lipoprotein component of BamABCDE complex)
MKASRAALAVILAAVVWGCTTGAPGRPTTVPRLEAVQPGMTAQQVRDAIGPPRTVDTYGGRAHTELWRYADGIVILDGGRVTYRFLTTAPKT